jgi:hypothetical protein
MKEIYIEKCDKVDMETGMRDCWNFTCQKNHTWKYYEIHNQPERLSEKTPKGDATV